MRDQHCIDVAQTVARRDRLDPPQRPDARAGDGIGEDADAVEVDDDGRVTDEVETETGCDWSGAGAHAPQRYPERVGRERPSASRSSRRPGRAARADTARDRASATRG